MLLFFFVLTVACSVPLTFHKNLAVSGKEQPSSSQCSECHGVIYDEWKDSAHSRAYANPFFRSITNDYMVKACLNCHSPQSVFDPEIKQREANLEEGVNCQACHLHNGRLQGPVEKHLPFEIHPIMEKNPVYLKSELCGNCHKQALEQYIESGEKEKTCQGCHMPEIKRTIIDNKPWVWLKDRYTFKRHSFNIQDEEDIADKIKLEVLIKGRAPLSGEVTVENKSIPHNIPTGGYGYHEVLLYISLIDDSGVSVEEITYSMTQEMQTSLKKGEKRLVTFTFSDKHAAPLAIKITLLRTDFDRKDTKILAKHLLNLK